MTQTETFIEMNGIMFKIERNGSVISELKGRHQIEAGTSKKYVGFFVNSDVKPGDWIISPYGERMYIADTIIGTGIGGPSELKAYFQTLIEYNSKSKPQTTVFNIGTASNSVIGNQSNFTVNINTSLQEAREQIQSSDSNDKEELQQIIDLLEQISENQAPIKQGILSKFSAVIQRNAWITSPIASIVVNMLLNQVHTVLP